MGDIEAVGLPFFGGCQVCQASIACYNAYPSKTNFLLCRSCIGDLGFATTDEFEEWCKQFDQDRPPAMMAMLTNSATESTTTTPTWCSATIWKPRISSELSKRVIDATTDQE
jgi:hypothetical protein